MIYEMTVVKNKKFWSFEAMQTLPRALMERMQCIKNKKVNWKKKCFIDATIKILVFVNYKQEQTKSNNLEINLIA